MELSDFVSVCDANLVREQIFLKRSIHNQDSVSFQSSEGCTVTVDSESVFDNVHRVCLNHDDSDVFVYLVRDNLVNYEKLVLGEITSFVIS